MSRQTSQQTDEFELLKSAQKVRDIDYSLELLDEILAANPEAIEALLIQTHLLALKGRLSLSAYRKNVASLVRRLKSDTDLSVPVGKKVLRGIQYSYSGAERIDLIRELLECIQGALSSRERGKRGLRILQAEILLALDDLSSFIDTVDNLSKGKNPSKALASLQKVARRCKSPGFPESRDEKVFGIGLSRTATSSLNVALNSLGYESIHWVNPHTQTIITDRDFGLFDAFTDIPVSYQFEALYDRYPSSKFIYTTRERASWIESISVHYRNLRGACSPGELNHPEIGQRFHGTAEPIETNLYSRHDTWGDAFDDFEHRVKRFFSNRQDGRFLELRVTEGEGWEMLCPFLGKDIPDEPFPNVNKRPGKMRPRES